MLDLFEHIDIYFEIAMSVDLFRQIIYIGKVPFSNNNREGTTTEFHSSTSRTPLVDY